MNGDIFGLQIVPDQMQVINPAIVLILIPIFDKIINPAFSNVFFMTDPLRKMTIGGLFAGAAFLSAGVLELILETTYLKPPLNEHADINTINTLPCDIEIRSPFNKLQTLQPHEMYTFKNVLCKQKYVTYTMTATSLKKCGTIFFEEASRTFEFSINAQEVKNNLIFYYNTSCYLRFDLRYIFLHNQ